MFGHVDKRTEEKKNCHQLQHPAAVYIYVGFFDFFFLCWHHYLQAPSSLQPPATFIETIKKESARGLNSIWRPAKKRRGFCLFKTDASAAWPRHKVMFLLLLRATGDKHPYLQLCRFHSVLFAEFQRPRGHTWHLESVGGSAVALFSWYVAHSPRKHRLVFSMC